MNKIISSRNYIYIFTKAIKEVFRPDENAKFVFDRKINGVIGSQGVIPTLSRCL